MKKRGFVAAGCLIAALLCGCGSSSSTAVSVDSVGNITGLGNVGATDKFGGMVVSEEEVKVEKSSSLTVKETKVSVGDTVKSGQVLFTYDTESLELTLEKQKLELEQLQTTVDTKTKEKAQLEKDAKSATGNTKLEYTIQIQSDEADIKEAQYNMKLKQKEISETEASMKDVDVKSPIDGTVKSIASDQADGSDSSSDDSSDDDGSSSSGGSSSSAFIVLAKSSSFEVKGMINELSANTLQEGQALLIRSRTDDTKTWTGTLDRIDWDTGSSAGSDSSSDDMSMDSGSSDSSGSMTSSTKYPFYVTLDDQDGLLLGQHVYIETNTGEASEDSGTALFSLPSYYIVDADAKSPYVWAENSKNKLEKRTVELGDYNEEEDSYGIISGLELSDYIAYPSDDCKEGVATEHYDSSAEGSGSVLDDGANMDDGEYTEDYTDEEGMTDDTVTDDTEESYLDEASMEIVDDGEASQSVVSTLSGEDLTEDEQQ